MICSVSDSETSLKKEIDDAAMRLITVFPLAIVTGVLVFFLGQTHFSPFVVRLLQGAVLLVFVAFITFTTSLWLMTRYPASRIMAFLMITPVFGVAAGVILLGEPLTIHLVIGLGVVIVGLWLVNRPPKHPLSPRAGRGLG